MKRVNVLLFPAIVVVVLAAVVTGTVHTTEAIQCTPTQGCSVGFWQIASDSRWEEAGYSKTQLLGSVFIIPGELGELAGDTLLEALSYVGGSDVLGGAQLLLKQAVAALLNAGHPDVAYMYDETTLTTMVDGTLLSMKPHAMIEFADALEILNNLGCPITPTGVILGSFNAKAVPAGILLEWETGSETDVIGFNLLRSEGVETPFVELTFIPAEAPGLLSGHLYTYLDTDVVPGTTHEYLLEVLDPGGHKELYTIEADALYWLLLPIALK